mgnify:CR=1 FL=1
MSRSDEPQGVTGNASSAARGTKRHKRISPRERLQIDLREALEAPVRVKQDGGVRSMDPYEAMLRQSVRKSLKERCVGSMKFLLGEAEKHKLIRQPPPPGQGGVFVVPKDIPEALQRKIFDDRSYTAQNGIPLARIMRLLLTAIDLERLKRCFNGR